MNELLLYCSQMKIIVITNGDILSDIRIPEAITTSLYVPYQDCRYLEQMAKIFTREWQHKDVLSMMKEWKRKATSPVSFKITNTLSSWVMFKKSE